MDIRVLYKRVLASRQVMAVVVVAMFSISGAVYLGASHAATTVMSKETSLPIQMTPYAGKGLTVPYTVKETIDQSRQVASGTSVYQLPPSYNSKNGSGTGVETTFYLSRPKQATSYFVCALIRRDKSAAAENAWINLVGSGASLLQPLKGSTSYQEFCTKPVKYRANFVPGSQIKIKVRIENVAAGHSMRVANISLSILGDIPIHNSTNASN
ncbi:MAG TPA: hypothetical protein VLF39_00600 [Candidatus Saccharimonadales bacterium]|nr:hypothetical protein [Candidatus Saccharimonadales bacterium]